MMTFPDKLQPFIEPDKITREDCIELIAISSEALKHCYLRGCSQVAVHRAMDSADSIQDKFTGIDNDSFLFDSFLATELTPSEWAQLTQFAGERFNQHNG